MRNPSLSHFGVVKLVVSGQFCLILLVIRTKEHYFHYVGGHEPNPRAGQGTGLLGFVQGFPMKDSQLKTPNASFPMKESQWKAPNRDIVETMEGAVGEEGGETRVQHHSPLIWSEGPLYFHTEGHLAEVHIAPAPCGVADPGLWTLGSTAESWAGKEGGEETGHQHHPS